MIKRTGNGEVILIAGGGKVLTDIAARFVNSDRDLQDIIASPESKRIVKNILSSGHMAATEFDYFVFGVQGYSRVTETQLVRKRHASFLIKSGRKEKGGKREMDVVLPDSINDHVISYDINGTILQLDAVDIIEVIEQWYNAGIKQGVPEEDLRYLKPQATEFKGIIAMNAHALRDWFKIRCCKNAQHEIRDMANKMLSICKNVSPDLFAGAGASCCDLGYCPEDKLQHKDCIGHIMTKSEALKLIRGTK